MAIRVCVTPLFPWQSPVEWEENVIIVCQSKRRSALPGFAHCQGRMWEGPRQPGLISAGQGEQEPDPVACPGHPFPISTHLLAAPGGSDANRRTSVLEVQGDSVSVSPLQGRLFTKRGQQCHAVGYKKHGCEFASCCLLLTPQNSFAVTREHEVFNLHILNLWHEFYNFFQRNLPSHYHHQQNRERFPHLRVKWSVLSLLCEDWMCLEIKFYFFPLISASVGFSWCLFKTLYSTNPIASDWPALRGPLER